jgi:hypothetical protein
MGYLVEGFRCLPQPLKISVLYLKLNHDRCLSQLSNSLFTNYSTNRSRDIRNVGWTIRGLNADRDEKFFSFPKRPDRLWGPPSLLFNGYGGCFPKLKQPEREVDHTSPFSAKVKNVWSYNSALPPPYAFMTWTGPSSLVPFDAVYSELMMVLLTLWRQNFF